MTQFMGLGFLGYPSNCFRRNKLFKTKILFDATLYDTKNKLIRMLRLNFFFGHDDAQ